MDGGPTSPDTWQQLHANQRATMAQHGIQAAMLLNGGAAVAILALMGNLATAPSNPIVDVGAIRWSLLAFGFGVFLAACTYAVGYLVHNVFAHDPEHATAHRYRWIGVAMIVGSLGLFLVGVAVAAMAMF
jgi:hypothetical protein